MAIKLQHFYDPETYTLSYIVYDEYSLDAIIIDPVLDYNLASSSTSTKSVEILCSFIKSNHLTPLYIIETHAHADHLTGACELRKRFPKSKIAVGKNITKVQKSFKYIYNFKDFNENGIQFDVLLEDRSILTAGTLKIKTLFTPGHTPACCSFLIEDFLFTGDALFMPDYGTGRCDFPLGSAKDLYHSVHEVIYKLPENTRYFTGHDYQPNGRELRFEATIKESKDKNTQLKEATTESDFIKFREERDTKLSPPKLLYPSLQININAGEFPAPEDNGQRYLKIPLLLGE